MHEISVGIAENLHFDVLGMLDVLLDKHLWPAKRGAGFALRFLELARQFLGIQYDPHPAPAPAEAGFDDDRIPDFLCRLLHVRD